MHAFTFNTARSIVFGDGSIKRLGEIARRELGERVVLVTDPGIAGSHLLDAALAALKSAHVRVTVYDKVKADPPEAVVLEGAALAREVGAEGVIGFGGGSSMDVAKLVALLAKGEETLDAVYGVGNVTGRRLPLVLIPTTAGTGSEVTPISIVTTGDAEKKGVVSPVLLPDVALLDPELTYALPHHVTAATGMDAIVHAIEAYTSTSANNNPLSRMLAKKALRLLGGSIRSAVREGTHSEARANMLLGAMFAGQAFANSPVAAVHALAYPIGGHYHVAHGLSNALVLPHVLRFNAEACAKSYAELAPHAFPHLTDVPPSRRAEAFIEALQHLSAEIGLEQRLRDVHIPQDDLPRLAEDAMKQTRLLVNNPRPLAVGDALAIYQAAW
ncbi:iron-containing alcohol dehydrogenase [Chelatococcus sp. SYSU_G07232]|uniref:Iron-containing alcohol dehydrogenase n=1 Tax=Chelatococcus albus TaxID=3047466 RepID=A0ABT7ADM2_9HYPH|nr:iron-containing alcohol dehydrogenase [Chelatococcus sp. SYSU_G07232]MDJ1157459.1 iron-containing alcohol dehydrogenase [Chelatococcus sp. SYSU_G07232]